MSGQDGSIQKLGDAQKLAEIKKMLLPNFASGPGIKWRAPEANGGWLLIKAQVPGYTYERVMELLGVSKDELKAVCDEEQRRFEKFLNDQHGGLLT